MVIRAQHGNDSQLAMEFPTQAPVPRKAIKLDAANHPVFFRMRNQVTSRLCRYSVCSLAKLLHSLKKANPAGYPHYFSELFRIFRAYEQNGKVRMDSLPTSAQAREAHSLFINMELPYLGLRDKNNNLKWKAVSPIRQQIASAKEHFSSLCNLAGLSSLFREGRYDDFLLVFDSVEKMAMNKAKKPACPGEPRVLGHEVRLFQEIRNSGIRSKVEVLSRTGKMQ
ncbi:hypothetical protein GF415_01810 [Candidatus Micrarchaeota archaeon]|nr:hypothetical protein [Candidatus Micrarchaeota archaeon]